MMSKSNSQQTNPVGETYMTYFPYDEPRPAQTDGMKQIYDTTRQNGFTVMEGACGTGKTLTALVPDIELVRDATTDFERVLVGTSVKQQMEAFQDEVDKINANLSADVDPVSAITLVGKADVDPYVQMGVTATEDVYDESERLRKNTLDLLKKSEEDTGYTADKLVKNAMNQGRSALNDPDMPDYPYPKVPPTIEEKGAVGGDEGENILEYDPFYAKYIALKQESDEDEGLERSQLPLDPKEVGLLRPAELRDAAGEAGICPHSVMKETLRHVDIIIGNYYHIFEPQTVERMTGEYIGDETLLVLDEAHNLVPDVRDLLGTRAAHSTITDAVEEIRELARYVEADADVLHNVGQTSLQQVKNSGFHDDESIESVESLLAEFENNKLELPSNETELANIAMEASKLVPDEFADGVLTEWADFIEEFAEAAVRKVNNEWSDLKNQYGDDDGTLTVPLRDPEEPGKDDLTRWASFDDDGLDLLRSSEAIGEMAATIRESLVRDVLDNDETVTTRAEWAGHVLSEWVKRDNTQYFRTLKLEERSYVKDRDKVEHEWEREYTLHLEIENCIPREELAKRLSQFGAGVLMSATLEPINVYREVTGMNILEDADDYDEYDFESRVVTDSTYGLEFPAENRTTLAVNATKFQWSQKGGFPFAKGGDPKMNDTREEYYTSIKSVVETTPGNTLVVMPSYSEAEWAGKLLRDDFGLDAGTIHIDKSSTNEQTSRMRKKFFRASNDVLVTGAHGTLTEGVDYKGDRLHSVVVCGVPIENTNNPTAKAIQTAYERAFGQSNGFDYAFTVPAVRKTRQAIGRVIRSDTDVGVRAFVDERYTHKKSEGNQYWDFVQQYLAPYEREELQTVEPGQFDTWMSAFWAKQG